ncbi:MAG: hypothetical protein AB1668_00990 [Nanoarchaeota archaeon]
MKQKRWFLSLYLVVAVVFGVLGLIESILAYFTTAPQIIPNYAYYYSLAMAVFSFLFFFFNIFSIAVFRHHGVVRIAYVLPAYYLICYVLFFILGFAFAGITVGWVTNALIAASTLTSLFEIGFGLYLMKRFVFKKEIKQ